MLTTEIKTRAFPVSGKEENHTKIENIRLPVAVRVSRTSVLSSTVQKRLNAIVAFSDFDALCDKPRIYMQAADVAISEVTFSLNL